MAESVAVINGKPGRNLSDQFERALVWKTCMREIAILDSRDVRGEDLQPDDELYTRQEAYQFLLEVICGLHSPLVGETEVMGQFKNFAVRAAEGPAAKCTAPWMQRLIGDAKRVRTNHLIGLGGRSYGQLAQRYLEDCPTIYVLGAGHLVQETLPSIVDHRVEIFCRRPEAAGELLERHANAAVHKLYEAFEGDDQSAPLGLIIAAPLSAIEIQRWIESLGVRFTTIVDLRGEGRCDKLLVEGTSVIHFEEILEDLESNRRFALQRVQKAREEIRERAEDFWQRYDIRPFGWEDLCA
ncbi:MAG: hypothetical protein R3338_01965 [Thermoanaerobaculia bacterium]|nr:hypothetical protein [Thermoanaerobaculia bacterium]